MSKLFVVAICSLVVAAAVAMPNGCGPPPNGKNPAECCDMPMVFDKGQKEACETKFGKPPQGAPQGPPGSNPSPPPPHHHGGGACFSECVLNSTKTVTNGNIDVTALKAYMKARLNGANDWQTVMEKALDDCISESAQKTNPPPMPAAAPGGQQCDPKFEFIMMCAHMKSFSNCPASSYKASAECDELKKASQKCPMPGNM